MRKRCGAKTKNGESCKAWAMANGFCRRHGGKDSGIKSSSGSPERKPVAEKCVVITSRGTPCKLPVVADGRCRMHQSNPAASLESPKPKKEKAKRT